MVRRITRCAIVVAFAGVLGGGDVAADCATAGPPTGNHAETCVSPIYGSVSATSATSTSGSYDSASTEVWVDGGSGANSGQWWANKVEVSWCGQVQAYSNNWLIEGYEWYAIAYWLGVSDDGEDCD
jgi:hypothetical protein